MRPLGMVGFVGLICLVAGCPGSGNPAAVLEGTWEVTFAEPGDLEGFEIQAIFDDEGQLTRITAESPEGGSARLDVDNATTTEVDDGDVTISIPSVGGVRILEGTLSEDENTIEGSLSRELELLDGDLEVTLPDADLTLTRVVENGG